MKDQRPLLILPIAWASFIFEHSILSSALYPLTTFIANYAGATAVFGSA